MKRFHFLTAILTLLLASSAMGYEQFEGKKITMCVGRALNIGQPGYYERDKVGFTLGSDLELPMPEDHYSFMTSANFTVNEIYRRPHGIRRPCCTSYYQDKYRSLHSNLTLLAGFKVNTRLVYFSGQVGFNFLHIPDYNETSFEKDEMTGDPTNKVEEDVKYRLSRSFGYAATLGINITRSIALGLNLGVFNRHEVESEYHKKTFFARWEYIQRKIKCQSSSLCYSFNLNFRLFILNDLNKMKTKLWEKSNVTCFNGSINSLSYLHSSYGC